MTASNTLIPVQTRDERRASTNPDDFADVTGREYEWHLSPVEKLNDLFVAELSNPENPFDVTSTGPVSYSWISMNDAAVGLAGKPEEKPAARAWDQTGNAFLVDIAADDVSEVTLERSSLTQQASTAHTVIRVAPFAKTTVVLRNSGTASLIENVEIVAGESSSVTLVSVQEWAADARHLATHFVTAGRCASVKHVVVTLSGEIVRLNTQARLSGAGSSVELLGLYFADAGEHLEHQVFVDHIAEQTKSRVTYKGALQGQGARTVWIGDVLIGAQATGTDSYEQNRNLVLTDGTRADSIPNLEIKTGDIAGAGHASATGRFDDDQLFYLQARGISEEEARQLVVRGFLNEVVQQIGIPHVEEHIQAALDRELEAVGVGG